MTRPQFLQSIISKDSWLGERWRYDNAGRKLVHGWYEGAVFSGRITPIEKLPTEQKQEYWNAALTAKRDRETSIQIAKVIYYLHIAYESQENRREPNHPS